MRKYNVISGMFFLVLAAATCIMAYRLKLGTVREPGAGLVPFGAAALLGLMSLGLIIRQLLPSTHIQEKETGGFEGIAWVRLAFLVCSLLAYGFFLEVLGFHLCTFILMSILLGVVSRQGLLRTFAFSVLIVLFVYLIFEVWLGCPFPRGSFNI